MKRVFNEWGSKSIINIVLGYGKKYYNIELLWESSDVG